MLSVSNHIKGYYKDIIKYSILNHDQIRYIQI